jgi:hypothetical protein
MALSLPTGTTYALATVYSAAVNVTAGTNATEAVLTATNTFALNDFVEYTGGWTRANNRVFRVKAATGTTVTLEGLDTTTVSLFPAGAAIGSLRKITTWVPITQMISCQPSGGEPKYATGSFIDNESEINLPDGYSAQSLAMEIGDDPALPHHAALKSAAELRKIAAIKAALPAGGVILYSGYISFDESPSMTKGQIMAVKAGAALQGRPVRYAS